MKNLMDTPVLIPESLFLPIGLSQAMESISQTQRQVAQLVENFIFPMQQMQKTITSMMEPILQAQRILENSPFLKMMEDIQEANKRMAQLMTIHPAFPYLGRVDVIDGEFVEKKEAVSSLHTEVVVIPQAVLLPTQVIAFPTKRAWGKMGLKQISGGNFSYKRITLKGLSLRNKEGQALGLLLANADLFISDQSMLGKFYAKDTFARSKIIQLLKDKFKANSLRAVIERQGDGYILITIGYLQ